MLGNTFFFVLGVSFAFFLLGLGFTAAGRFFSRYQSLFTRAGGILVVLFGLYQLGILGQSRLIASEHRLPFRLDRFTMGPLAALLLGFTFSFAWTPCVGPALASVLLLASSAASAARGFPSSGSIPWASLCPFWPQASSPALCWTFSSSTRRWCGIPSRRAASSWCSWAS